MTELPDTPPPTFQHGGLYDRPGGASAAATPGLAGIRRASAAADEVWTFAELEDAVLRIAGGLAAAGMVPGERILMQLDNSSIFPLLFFGAIAGGFVPIPTSPQLTEPEVRFLLADSGADGPRHGSGARDLDRPCRHARAQLARYRRHDRPAARAGNTPTRPPMIRHSSSIRPAPPLRPRACCTRSVPRMGGGRCTRAGTASGRTIACCMRAPSTGHSRSAPD